MYGEREWERDICSFFHIYIYISCSFYKLRATQPTSGPHSLTNLISVVRFCVEYSHVPIPSPSSCDGLALREFSMHEPATIVFVLGWNQANWAESMEVWLRPIFYQCCLPEVRATTGASVGTRTSRSAKWRSTVVIASKYSDLRTRVRIIYVVSIGLIEYVSWRLVQS